MSVFIFGYQGNLNFGDDATCISLVENLNDYSKEKIKITIYSPGRYFKKNFTELKNIDINFSSSICSAILNLLRSKIIMIQGGDHLHDYGYILNRLKVFSVFICLSLFAKLSHKRLLVINTGFRVRTSFGQTLLRLFLIFTSSISVRDEESYSTVSKFIQKKLVKGFDSAILINKQMSHDNSTEYILGISITPVFSNYFHNKRSDSILAMKIAQSLSDFLEDHRSVKICFLAFNINERVGDLLIIEKIKSLINNKYASRVKLILYTGDLQDFIYKLTQLQAVVCCKYHSIIISSLLKKPAIVINYHPKNLALVRELSMPDNSVIFLDDILNGQLNDKLQMLVEQPENFIPRISLTEKRNAALRGILSVWGKK